MVSIIGITLQMARDAWNENALVRPTFSALRPVIKLLKPDA